MSRVLNTQPQFSFLCLRFPETTAIGYENHYRKAWVEKMLQVEAKERGPCLSVISSTISAATFFASTSLALSSLIGTWVGSTSNDFFKSIFVYDGTDTGKCFLVSWVTGNLLCNHITAVDIGPIPMFVTSVAMVVILHFLDTNSTPLHHFQPAKSRNLLRKIGQNITAVSRVVEHQKGLHGDASTTTSGAQT
uniref:Uncharacterized protein n=1 Tax=Quercus lobata TaxID=97700 RepID=A0A7N2MBI0_QUELO